MVGQNRRKTLLRAILYMLPALLVIAVFVIYPLFYTIRLSFVDDFNVYTQQGSGFGLDAYKYVLKDRMFILSLKNTLIYALVTVPISLVLSLIIAILLNSGIKASKFFRTAYFLPYVTNAIAVGLAFRFMFHSQYGLINMILSKFGIDAIGWLSDPNMALTSLCIFGIWSGLAFKIVIFLAGLQGIDEQLYQAARIDEASKWQQFIHITVPQLAPIIAYQLVIAIIGSFKVYTQVVGLFGDAGPVDSAMTMVYYMFERFYSAHQYANAAASGVIMFIIIIAFTMIQMKVSNRNNND